MQILIVSPGASSAVALSCCAHRLVDPTALKNRLFEIHSLRIRNHIMCSFGLVGINVNGCCDELSYPSVPYVRFQHDKSQLFYSNYFRVDLNIRDSTPTVQIFMQPPNLLKCITARHQNTTGVGFQSFFDRHTCTSVPFLRSSEVVTKAIPWRHPTQG